MLWLPFFEDDNEDGRLISVEDTMFESENGLVPSLFRDFLMEDVVGEGGLFEPLLEVAEG